MPAHGRKERAKRDKSFSPASYYATDRYWDNNGHRQSQPAYDQYALNPYAEYGLWDGFTIGTNLSLQDVHEDAAPAA